MATKLKDPFLEAAEQSQKAADPFLETAEQTDIQASPTAQTATVNEKMYSVYAEGRDWSSLLSSDDAEGLSMISRDADEYENTGKSAVNALYLSEEFLMPPSLALGQADIITPSVFGEALDGKDLFGQIEERYQEEVDRSPKIIDLSPAYGQWESQSQQAIFQAMTPPLTARVAGHGEKGFAQLIKELPGVAIARSEQPGWTTPEDLRWLMPS